METRLAMGGGKPVVPEELKRPWPIVTEQDIEAVATTLRRGPWGGAYQPEGAAFEDEWAEYCGTKYCLVTNSGTAALHSLIAGIGVEPGDEVIIPAYTFVASATSVLHQNAIPIFVDIDPTTYNMDPQKIEAAITKKTKAIMAVDMHGLAADYDEINKIAAKYNIPVIEDACQAHGALYKGKKTGNLTIGAAFSLQATKNLPAGEGGIITTNSKEVRDKASVFRIFGERLVPGEVRPYNAYDLGWNYRLPEYCSTLARRQLLRLNEVIRVSQENADYLSEQLRKIPGVIPPYVPKERTHTYYMYRVRIDAKKLGITDISSGELRRAIQFALSKEGVTTFEYQSLPVPGQTIFQTKKGYGKGCPWNCPYARKNIRYNINDYPETIKVLEESFMIGHVRAPNGKELMEYYAEAFNKVVNNLDEVVETFKKKRNVIMPSYFDFVYDRYKNIVGETVKTK